MADQELPLTLRLHSDGSLRSECPPGADERCTTLASFIQSDVQTSLRHIALLLDASRDVEQGRRTRWEGTGNAFTLTMTQTEITIENAIFPDDPAQHYTHAELRNALLDAARVIGGKTSSD